jgi:hypothetical protein
MKVQNGWTVYEDGETCEGCGLVQKQTEVDKKNGDPAGFVLECPLCCRPGCDECMPAGRGCPCPECEDEDQST